MGVAMHYGFAPGVIHGLIVPQSLGPGAHLLALTLVQYGLFLLEQPVARLAGLYQAGIVVKNLSAGEMLSILGIGVALGLAGSWLAAARHMRRIEPR